MTYVYCPKYVQYFHVEEALERDTCKCQVVGLWAVILFFMLYFQISNTISIVTWIAR